MLGIACTASLAAGAGGLMLEFGRLAHPAVVLDGLSVRLGGTGLPGAIRVGRLTAAGHVIDDLSFACPKLGISGGIVSCKDARLVIPGVIDDARVDLTVNPETRSGSITAQSAHWGRFEARLSPDGTAEVRLHELPIGALAKHFPVIGDFGPGGFFSGRLSYHRHESEQVIALEGAVAAGRFSSADGLQAAEHLQLSINLGARSSGPAWAWHTRMDWTAGEAYLHPLYFTAGPSLSARGRVESGRAFLEHAALTLEGVEALELSAEIDIETAQIARGVITVERGDLAQLGPRFITPVFAPAHAESIRFAGLFNFKALIAEGALEAFELSLEQAGFSLTDSALSFGPVSGVVPWRAAGETRVALQVDGGRWQKLELGPFALDALLDGPRFRAHEISIPILDGRLLLSDLDLGRQGTGWSGRGGVVIEPISMKLLTEAVGLPPMSGVLSASMPSLNVRPGEIALEGALVISVFDGYLQVTGLQVLEPFGSAPHLFGDIEARNLDLFQLTETFSFGSMTGFIDADVLGLELAHWTPVRFDAALRSSAGDYRRRISQRAVENIGALGGPGAALAIQRGFLSFFDSFGYRTIGLSCKLRGDVCVMGGIVVKPDEGAFTIVQGGGVPALNVIGYNRRVDWVELVDRIKRVVESNAAPVIE